MQLELSIQIPAPEGALTIASPYSFASKLKLVGELRKTYPAKAIAQATGLTGAEVTRYVGLLDKLIPEAIAAIEAGRLVEGNARKLAKLPADQQERVCDYTGKITAALIEEVAAELKAEAIAALPDSLTLPGFEWAPQPQPLELPQATPQDRVLALLEDLVELLPGNSGAQELLEDYRPLVAAPAPKQRRSRSKRLEVAA